MPNSLPRPSTDLFPEALKLSPKQHEVLTQLQHYPRGARAAEVAKDLGMHVNTARGHIDELIHVGAVTAVPEHSTGRGRPSLIFQARVPDNRAIADEYVSLISVLTTMLAGKEELDDFSSPQARELGRQWARATGADIQSGALDTLFATLRDMGFDPSQGADPSEIELNACPFVSSGTTPSPFVCAIHAGFLQEASGADADIALTPMQRPEVCQIEIKPA